MGKPNRLGVRRLPAGVALWVTADDKVLGIDCCRDCATTDDLRDKPPFRRCMRCRNDRNRDRASR